MSNALERATAISTLQAVFRLERQRLINSCFGPDRVTGAQFAASLPRQLRELRYRVSEKFKPGGLLAIAKLKPSGGKRIICVPTVADRLLQFSLLNQLRPRLAAMKLDNNVSFGIAPGAAKSVLGARKFACKARREHPWVYKADINQFFDRLDRDLLRDAVRRRVRLTSVVGLLEAFIDAEIVDGLDRNWRHEVHVAGIQAGQGVRQGMPLSPLLAGAYLCDVDQALIKRGAPTARYVDDIVAFFDGEMQCLAFHEFLRKLLGDIGLTIGEPCVAKSKTQIFRPDQPADFLGMEVVRHANGSCVVLVPDRVISDVRRRVADASSPSELLERRVHLTSMGRYFDSVVRGYQNSYRDADNYEAFSGVLQQDARSAQEVVVRDLFGDRLKELSHEQLVFVGIDPEIVGQS